MSHVGQNALAGMPAAGVLIPEFPSQTHAFFWREIQAWRQAGVNVQILSTRRPPADSCRHEWAQEARQQTAYFFPPRSGSAARLALRPIGTARAAAYVAGLRQSPIKHRIKLHGLIPCAADLRRHCDQRGIRHIHCHSFANAAHLCALARILGGPSYSLTLHGDLPVYGVDHQSKLARCLAVTTAGPHLIEPVAALGFPRQKILSNPMGVDTERFTPAVNRPAISGELAVITVARLNRNKGHRFALAALRRLVDAGLDIKYTIVGDGPYRPDIDQQVSELRLKERVSLLGERGEAEVLELLRQHDAFVLSSVGLGEAAPVSVMEAMSCGLPVVASIIGSTPAMIHDGQSGFLTAQEDVAAIEHALKRIATDIVLRREIATAARRTAVEQFDARASSLRLLEHLRRCGAKI